MTQVRIYLSPPHMSGHEEAYVAEAFQTNWIAPLGPNVEGFERELANYTGVGHVAALSSGTAALHLALIMLGVGQGDEVLCSSFTFSASANPIVYQGARPVFVGSEADTWNMSPEALETAIEARLATGKKPKAIMLVHLYGMPAKLNEIMRIAKRYDIPVIEDAAEALGSSYQGRALGSFGVMSALSFNGNKIITTSGGGALLTNKEAYAQKARFLATQARDPAPHYQHSEIGYNYRMSNICAGVGRGQLHVIGDYVAKRRATFEAYTDFFKAVPGIQTAPQEPEGSRSNRWLSTILVDPEKTGGLTRETLRLALEAENIEARPLWKPLHLQPIFKDYPYYGDGLSEHLFEQGLCLPSGSSLSDADLKRIQAVVQEALEPTPIGS